VQESAGVYWLNGMKDILGSIALQASAMLAVARDVTVEWSVQLYHSCTVLLSLDGMKCHLVGIAYT